MENVHGERAVDDKSTNSTNTETQKKLADSESMVSISTDWASIYAISFVGFLMGVQGSVLGNGFWPYLKQMDSHATESFFGIIMAANNIGHAISSPLVGLASNKMRKIKILILIGKLTAISACLLYLFTELFTENQRYSVFFVQLLLGLAGGFLGLMRTHLAMASSTNDRSRAIAINTFSVGAGFMLGPAFQLLYTTLGYPGVSISSKWHINIYTAPIYTALLANCLAIAALLTWFRDVYEDTEPCEEKCLKSREDEDPGEKKAIPFDVVAVVICILMRLYVGASQVGMGTLEVPMTMVVFGWNNQSAVFYNSIISFVTGGLGLFVNLMWIFSPFMKRVSERLICQICLLSVVLFYLLTFPWPFLTERIPCDIHTTLSTQQMSTAQPEGCSKFSWVDSTPAVNLYVYAAAYTILNGIVMPTSQIALDTLFSKVLGRIKQGLMQGIFICSGDIVNTAGPILIMALFSSSGTRYVWLIYIITGILVTTVWRVSYRKLSAKDCEAKEDTVVEKSEGSKI